MIDSIYKKEFFLKGKTVLRGFAATGLLACAGLQANYTAAETCYADSITALQNCLNAAEADEDNWHEIQLKERTYYLTSPLTLTKGKVRLVGAGRVSNNPNSSRAGEPYSAHIERASDRRALDRAKFFVLDGQDQTRIFSAIADGANENNPGEGASGLLTLYVQGVTFKNGNPSDNLGGGGLRFIGRKLIVEHSIFTGNSDSALWHYAGDQQSITDSYFYNNTAEYSSAEACPPSGEPEPKFWGGAITADGSDYEIYRSTFENNHGCHGGAIYTKAETGLYASTVTNNSAKKGGGVYIANGFNGAAGITHSTIYANHASVEGGGLYFEQQQSVERWSFYNNILAGNTALNSTFSDCYLEGEPIAIYSDDRQIVDKNILGRIGVGSGNGCSHWLIYNSDQATGVLDPELEELAYNGSIGLQLKTHLPKASSISLDVAESFNGECSDQRTRGNTIATSPQNKCAVGATQRIQQVNGTLGAGEAAFVYSQTYKMVLTESQEIQIDMISDEADARLTLTDASHNVIADNTHSPFSASDARITRQLSAGTYYISAMHETSSGFESYPRDYFLSVNAEVQLTPSLVLIDIADIASNLTLGQTGSGRWELANYPRPPNTRSEYFYRIDPSPWGGSAIFESDFFDPEDAQLYFKYFINGESSGSLYLDVEIDGIWHFDYWVRKGSVSNHRSPDWQQASYDFNALAEQGHDKIRIRIYGSQYQPFNSSHLLLLDSISISRYSTWMGW